MSIGSSNSTNSLNARWPIGSPVGNGAAVTAPEQCMFPHPGAEEIRPSVADSNGSLSQRARFEAYELPGSRVVARVAGAFQARVPTTATDVAVRLNRLGGIHVSSPSEVAVEPDQHMQQAHPLPSEQEAVQERAEAEALQALMAAANRQGISAPQIQQHRKEEVSIGTADDAILPMEVDLHRSRSFDSEESTSQPHGGTVDDLDAGERAANALLSMRSARDEQEAFEIQAISTLRALSIREGAKVPPTDKNFWPDWILENVAMGTELTLHETCCLLGDTSCKYIGTVGRILQNLRRERHFQLDRRRNGGRLIAFYRRIDPSQQSGTGDVLQDDLSSEVRRRRRIMTIATAQEPPTKCRRTQNSAEKTGSSSVRAALGKVITLHDRILRVVLDETPRTAEEVGTLLQKTRGALEEGAYQYQPEALVGAEVVSSSAMTGVWPAASTTGVAIQPPSPQAQGSAERAGASYVRKAGIKDGVLCARILKIFSDRNPKTAEEVDALLREKEGGLEVEDVYRVARVQEALNAMCKAGGLRGGIFERINIGKGYTKLAYRRLDFSPTIWIGNAPQGGPSFDVERRSLEPASRAPSAVTLPRPLIQPHQPAAPVVVKGVSSSAMTVFRTAPVMTGFTVQETPAQAQGSAARAEPSPVSAAEIKVWLLGDQILNNVLDGGPRTAEAVDALLREKGIGLEGEDGDRVARVQEALNALCRAKGTRDFECIKIGTGCLYRRLGCRSTIGAGNAFQGGPSFDVERRSLEPASRAPSAVTLPRPLIQPHQPAAPVVVEGVSSSAMTGVRTAASTPGLAIQPPPPQAQGSVEGTEPSSVHVAPRSKPNSMRDRILSAVSDKKLRTAKDVDTLLREQAVCLVAKATCQANKVRNVLNKLCEGEYPLFERIKIGSGSEKWAYQRLCLSPTLGERNALQGGPSFGGERRLPLDPASRAPGAVTLSRPLIQPHQPAAPVGVEVVSSSAMTGVRTAASTTGLAIQPPPTQAQGSTEGAEPASVRVAEARVWLLCDRILRAVLDQEFRTAEQMDALLREKGLGLEGEDGDRVARVQEALNALCRAEGTSLPRFEHIKVGIGCSTLAYRRVQL